MRMTGYEKLDADLAVTTYENGDQVFVNRGLQDVEVQGITVPARGFSIKEAE